MTPPQPTSPRRRIVLTTFGSLGDLHPYIAIALGLQARGHDVVIATSAYYRRKIESLGLGFRAVRPDFPDPEAAPGVLRRVMDRRTGSTFVIRELIMPALRDSYTDTLAAAEGADLLVSHILTLTTRLVAEQRGLPWVSTYLQPLGLFSAHDPPVLPQVRWLAKLRGLGPAFHRPLFELAKWTVRSWSAPWHRLRAEIGLAPDPRNPLFEGQHSPWLVLMLFSRLLADGQPDWPAPWRLTGFPFYDRDGDAGLAPELAQFLAAGQPPLVFTLGSSAVADAGPFYEHSARAAQLLGRRAVLLVGTDPRNRPVELPPTLAAFAYAPYSELFPRTCAIVHQGGVGTTAQAMRAGRPMLVMPYAHDQPDNAARVARLGIARTITRERYSPDRAAAELRRLLDDPGYAARAERVGTLLRQEEGVRHACAALLELLEARRVRRADPPSPVP